MKKIIDKMYLLTRPCRERKLFNFIKAISENDLSLSDILSDEKNSNKSWDKSYYKPAVDAIFFNVFGVFDTSDTTGHEYLGDTNIPICNVSLKEYIKNLATLISTKHQHHLQSIDAILENPSAYKDKWNYLQQQGKTLYNMIKPKYNLTAEDWYAYGYPKLNSNDVYDLKKDIALFLNVDCNHTGIVLCNVSTIIAFYLKRLI